ncbi:hypothetical protein Tco_0870711 [Tanacetum coccineum]
MQAWDKFLEIKHAQPEEVQELLNKLVEDVRNVNEELAEFTNTPSWNLPTSSYDGDDDEYSFTTQEHLMTCSTAITPVLLTEEPVDSLIMKDEHLDTIPATKSDKVIKSSVEILVPIPTFKDHSEIVVDSNDDSSSSDDDSFSSKDIEYVDASPPDAEIVSLEVVEIVIPEIDALKDNPTPSSDFMTKSSSTSLNLFLEETNTVDNSLPETETFRSNLEEISSGSTTTRSDLSLPNYEAFNLDDDHINEKSSGSTTTHADFSLPK